MKNPSQCKAKISYGSVWEAGRKRCSRKASGEEGLCGIHLNQLRRREERNGK